jgi:EAL domain-containing protein (putative c-di-GMP-specific phosphodiesterase class I)
MADENQCSKTARGLSMEQQSAIYPDFTFAFQPIVDVVTREIASYEALIRGPNNAPAHHVFEQVPTGRMHLFDRQARINAIVLATRLGIDCHLNLNFLPLSLISSAASVVSTLEAANLAGLPIERIVLEVTEGEVIGDQVRFAELINEYRGIGVKVAIDDFGAGYSGLNLLADFQPDQLKLDMSLVRGIERHGPRQAIVRAIGLACYDLGIDLIAEGVETVEEYAWLAHSGVKLFQGYLFAKPGFELLPAVTFPEISR